jgi:hypothetical protein
MAGLTGKAFAMAMQTIYPPTKVGSSKKRTKTKVAKTAAAAIIATTSSSEKSDLVWGATGIGGVINREPKKVYYYLPKLIAAGAVQKWQGRLVGSRSKLLGLMGGAQ